MKGVRVKLAGQLSKSRKLNRKLNLKRIANFKEIENHWPEKNIYNFTISCYAFTSPNRKFPLEKRDAARLLHCVAFPGWGLSTFRAHAARQTVGLTWQTKAVLLQKPREMFTKNMKHRWTTCGVVQFSMSMSLFCIIFYVILCQFPSLRADMENKLPNFPLHEVIDLDEIHPNMIP